MQPVVKTIELPGRTTLSYAEQGDRAGLPVIALHGATDSWRSFELAMQHLPRSLRVFALTQRGHGDSARPASGYAPRDFADDVAAFMDAQGIAQAVIAGHSMGATNALRFAIEHPDRALGLMLLGAFASYRDKPELVEFWRSAVEPLADPIDPAFVRDFQQSTLAQAVPPEFLDMVVRESLKLPARVWRAAFEGFMTDDGALRLDAIRAPTLIAWGVQDAYCRRADQEALLAAIAGSSLRVYGHAGHALHWEEPERFARDLARFALSVAGAVAAAAA